MNGIVLRLGAGVPIWLREAGRDARPFCMDNMLFYKFFEECLRNEEKMSSSRKAYWDYEQHFVQTDWKNDKKKDKFKKIRMMRVKYRTKKYRKHQFCKRGRAEMRV